MPLPPKLQARHECLTLIVLGATGNLAQRKLFPSLFNLFAAGQLPPRVRVVAAARDGHSDESFGDVLRASIADAWATQRRRCAQGMECTGDGDGDGDGDETTRDRGGRPPTPTSTSISSASPSKASSARAPFDAFKIQADVELDLKMRGVVAPVLPSNTATIPPALVNEFLALVRFARFNAPPDDASTSPPSASSLLSDVFALTRAHEAEHADAACLAHNRLFYLALPHALYAAVSDAVAEEGRAASGWTRLVLEKPFGHDAASAAALNASLRTRWSEGDLFRIDRYLGKEVIDNLLVMRFANRMLTPIWNRENVASVQITFEETGGAATAYFDEHGIVRDVMQNHLLQVMAVLAMDRPVSLEPEDIRDAKLKVLRQVRRVDPAADAVAGQYVAPAGDSAGSSSSKGYLEQSFVKPDSKSPTFAMVVLRIKNERWDGVPFVLKAGKGLGERRSEIRIQLKDVPGDIFDDEEEEEDEDEEEAAAARDDSHPGCEPSRSSTKTDPGPNEFVIRLQPHEEMYMKLTIKEPGLGVSPVPSEMELSSRWRATQLRKEATGETVRGTLSRLLLDAVFGHRAHFVRGDELEAAWAIVDPVNEAVERGDVAMATYALGGDGPEEANALASRVGVVQTRFDRRGSGAVPSDVDLERRARLVPSREVFAGSA